MIKFARDPRINALPVVMESLRLRMFIPRELDPEMVIKTIESRQDEYGWLTPIQLLEEYIETLKSLRLPIQAYEQGLERLVKHQIEHEDISMRDISLDDVKIDIDVPISQRNYDTWKKCILLETGRIPQLDKELFDKLQVPDDMRQRLAETSPFQWFVTARELSFLNEEKRETSREQE